MIYLSGTHPTAIRLADGGGSCSIWGCFVALAPCPVAEVGRQAVSLHCPSGLAHRLPQDLVLLVSASADSLAMNISVGDRRQ